jgi:aspartate racemase
MKVTIGIIGLDPERVAELNREVIEYGNSIGLTNDQDFPEIIAIGVKSDNIEDLISQGKFCFDFGCDVLVMADSPGMSGLNTKLTEITSLPVLFPTGKNMTSLVGEVFNYANTTDNIRKPNIFFSSPQPEEQEIVEINHNLENDRISRSQRISDRKEPYSFLQNKKVFGVLGGAGPGASATFCEKLVRKSVPYLHYSVNSAPGKHLFEIGHGPSYVPHYSSAVDCFNVIGIDRLLVPCNTAHMRLDEFCNGFPGIKIIDIRESVLAADNRQMILLGTSRTTGIGLPDGQVGIYEKLRSEKHPNHPQFILPSSQQQEQILDAIFKVKKGELSDAKQIMVKVIDEIRKEYGDLPTLLACTELPLSIEGEVEFNFLNLIDPMELMAVAAREEMKREERMSRKRKLYYNSTDGEISSDSESENHKEEEQSKTENQLDDVHYLIIFDSKRNVYKIKVNSTNDHINIVKNVEILSELKKELYHNLPEEQKNERDRVNKGASYISFHEPSEELIKRINEFAENNQIGIINSQSQQIK